MTHGVQEPSRDPDERGLTSPERRLLVKSMVSLGTGLAMSSFGSSIALTQAPPPATVAPLPVHPVAMVSPDVYAAPIIPSSKVGRYYQVSCPPSQVPGKLRLGVTYALWVPGGVETIRGVIVHQHGAGLTAAHFGAYSAYDLQWQALAKKWDCALLGPCYHVLNDGDLGPAGSDYWFDPRLGSDKAFIKALDDFAAQTGHPELTSVPWAMWGHSAGAGWADAMGTLYPERIIAIYYRSGALIVWTDRPAMYLPFAVPDASYTIPRMCTVGAKENGLTRILLATYDSYHSHGAPTGLALDPRTGHECGDSRYLAIPFLDACLAMRLPEKGSRDQTLRPVDRGQAWLAPYLGDTALPVSEFKGDPKQAVWLPNAAVAKSWVDYVKTGTVADSSQPPAPFGVRVTDKGDQGLEVTWDAEVGFVSGLSGFMVLRDGHGVGRLPQLVPDAVYGRQLFQGLSYHDTPIDPLPQMIYMDTSAKRGAAHKYTVIAFSSAGVPSQPSAPASL